MRCVRVCVRVCEYVCVSVCARARARATAPRRFGSGSPMQKKDPRTDNVGRSAHDVEASKAAAAAEQQRGAAVGVADLPVGRRRGRGGREERR